MLPPGCEWVFPSLGSATGHVHTIRKAFRRSVERAGLDPDQITPHTLRHTAVTHLVQAGVDLPTVQRISGHKTLSMVARYAHQSGSHIEAAMDRLEGRVSGAQADNVRQLKPKSSA
jgi:integrase